MLIVQQSLSDGELRAWGWRIPFFIGAVCAVVALFLRASLTETSSAETRSHKEAGSLREIFRHHTRAFLIVLGYTAGGSLIFYTFTTYMQKYLINTAHMNDRIANVVMTAVLFTYMIMQPFFGMFSDRFGRKTSMLLFGGLATLSTVPLMYAIADVKSPLAAYALIVVALAIVSVLARRNQFSADYYSPVDVLGLYWHFVDVVWIFLLPMLYLLGTHER